MVTGTEAYVDTSALIALADGSDTFHPLFRRLFGSPPPLVTTPLVIAEGHGWFLRRFDSYRALQFVSMVESMKPLRMLAVGPKLQEAGYEQLRRYSDQRLTLADAVGLELMRMREISCCWSTDRHMALAGASLVIHEHGR